MNDHSSKLVGRNAAIQQYYSCFRNEDWTIHLLQTSRVLAVLLRGNSTNAHISYRHLLPEILT
jgi:hypothetical protein